MSSKKNIPAIRFTGFDGEWKTKINKDVCCISTGKSNTQDKTEDGLYPFFVRSSIVERSNKYLFDEEAVLTAGDGVGTGKVFHYINGKYDLHQRVYRMYNFEGVSGKYFFYYFANHFYDRVMAMTAKSSVDSVRLEMISEMIIDLPHNICEQNKISVYLSNIDHLITQSTKRLEKLKNLKKAYLEKMFPRGGTTTPELRFKGFSDEWREDCLETMASFSKGRGYSKNDLKESGYPIILYGRLYTKYETAISRVDTYVSFINGALLSKGNEVIVPASGETSEDISVASAVLQKDVVLGGDLNIIYPNDNIDSVFLALSISHGSIHNHLSNKAQGKSVVHLRNNDLKTIRLKFPKIEEQQKIGNFFRNIDEQIAKQTEKLDKLKNIKKACLDKMFL